MEDVHKTFLAAYEAHNDALFRYGLFKVTDRELAKDLVQETFTKTWDYLSRGKPIDNIKAFLYKTLNHMVIDHYRRKKATSLDEMQDAGFEPSVDTTKTESDTIDGRRLVALVEELPDPYRTPVFLRYVEELTITEISNITGDAENTVAVHIHRGIKKLKELYGKLT